MAECPYFCTNVLEVDERLTRHYEELDSFVILICTEGEVTLEAGEHSVTLSKGRSLLLPAAFKKVTLYADKEARLLESYIP
ncbi:MAG: hypothetical protein WBH03_16735 [Cyclobacteriaceae bacterium]